MFRVKGKRTGAENFPDVTHLDLPPVTFLTGVNGTGKTQFLQALKNRSLVIDEIDSVHFFEPHAEPPTGRSVYNYNGIMWSDAEMKKEWTLNHVCKHLNITPDNKNQQRAEIKKLFGNPFGKAQYRLTDAPYWNFFTHISPSSGKPSHVLDEIRMLLDVAKYSGKFLHDVNFDDYNAFHRSNISQSLENLDALASVYSNYITDRLRQAKDAVMSAADGSLSPREFLKKYDAETVPPWIFVDDAIKNIRSICDLEEYFDFELSHPTIEYLTLEKSGGSAHTVKIIRPNLPDTDINSLSGGELALVQLIIFFVRAKYLDGSSRKLYLLDEPDAGFHPKFIECMMKIIELASADEHSFIVLSTHSPSTIALAQSESILTFSNDGGGRIATLENTNEALQSLTGGHFYTLDSGFKILDRIAASNNPLIISEGYNYEILQKAIKLTGLNFEVHKASVDKTDDKKLKILYNFFREIDKKCPIIFLVDGEASVEGWSKHQKNTYVDKLPLAPDGLQKGIEGSFDRETLDACFGKMPYPRLSGKNKRAFSDWISSNGTEKNLRFIIEALVSIQRLTDGPTRI